MELHERAVYIGGLPSHMEEEDVAAMCKGIGRVTQVHLCEKTSGAYVLFSDKQAVTKAVTSLRGKACPVRTRSQKLRLQLLAKEEEAEETIEELFQSLSPTARRRTLSRIVENEKTRSPLKPTSSREGEKDPHIIEIVKEPLVIASEPKLSVFSGGSGDTSYKRWRHEVQCLLEENQNEAVVRAAIRKSLRGPAWDVASRLGGDITKLLEKLETLYGSVTSREVLWEKFYGSRQDVEEGCTTWSTRLEGLLYAAVDGNIGAHEESILRHKFWSSLRDTRVKDALRLQRQLPFQQLVQEARALEEEFIMSKPKTKQILQTQRDEVTQNPDIKLNDLLERIKKLELELVASSEKSASLCARTCFQCRQEGHMAFGCRAGTDIICYKCNQKGHIARACTHLNM